MSTAEEESRLELHLFSDREAPELIELLTAVAHFHKTGARLDWGHTVSFGRPWLPQSLCSFGLISLPFLDGPKLEYGGPSSQQTRFLWLIPITSKERDIKVSHGLEALERLFEAKGLDYANAHREIVA